MAPGGQVPTAGAHAAPGNLVLPHALRSHRRHEYVVAREPLAVPRHHACGRSLRGVAAGSYGVDVAVGMHGSGVVVSVQVSSGSVHVGVVVVVSVGVTVSVGRTVSVETAASLPR